MLDAKKARSGGCRAAASVYWVFAVRLRLSTYSVVCVRIGCWMKAAWRGQNSRGIPPTRTRWANTAPRCYTTSTAREKMEAGFVMLSCASERRASPRTRRCWRHAASILSRCSAVRRKTTARARSWRCTRSAPKFSETSGLRIHL